MCNAPSRGLAAFAVVAGMAASGFGQGMPFDFTIRQSASGIDAAVTNRVNTDGTLIGNYDAAKNPDGTRTKPGLFGDFGPKENVAVPVTVVGQLSGNSSTRTAGAFGMELNPTAGTASISDFAAAFLAGGSLVLPASVIFTYQSFRTRSPTSTFPGGLPITIPFGEAEVTALTAVQLDAGAPGTLVQTGPGTYEFVVAPIVQIDATFNVLGNEFVIPGTPSALLLAGVMTLSGETAVLVSVQPIEFGDSQEVELPLPQIPFDLPTILPPGDFASVLLDLTVRSITTSFEGTNRITADGRLVPSPGAAGLLLLGVLATRRRR